MKEPRTRKEWQEAVDGAYFLLALDSARQYGLVTGGPTANFARCVDIINRGKLRKITPTGDAIERHLAAWQDDQQS